jgi:hypothetical protein
LPFCFNRSEKKLKNLQNSCDYQRKKGSGAEKGAKRNGTEPSTAPSRAGNADRSESQNGRREKGRDNERKARDHAHKRGEFYVTPAQAARHHSYAEKQRSAKTGGEQKQWNCCAFKAYAEKYYKKKTGNGEFVRYAF